MVCKVCPDGNEWSEGGTATPPAMNSGRARLQMSHPVKMSALAGMYAATMSRARVLRPASAAMTTAAAISGMTIAELPIPSSQRAL